MMTFNNSKMQIHLVAKQGTYNNNDGLAETNYIITCCLLYALISSIVSSNSSYEGQVSKLAKQYLQSYISIVEGLRKKYVSYSLMRSNIKSWGYPKFYEMTEAQAEKIISLYYDKTEVVQFDTNIYSPYMYNIEGISDTQNDRLRKIHYKVMVPIVQYCVDNYGANLHDVEVYSIDNVQTNPGKEIIFKINDISPAKLVNDILHKIGISNYIYSASQYGEYVDIIIK